MLKIINTQVFAGSYVGTDTLDVAYLHTIDYTNIPFVEMFCVRG
jgi:hypothetical protein